VRSLDRPEGVPPSPPVSPPAEPSGLTNLVQDLKTPPRPSRPLTGSDTAFVPEPGEPEEGPVVGRPVTPARPEPAPETAPIQIETDPEIGPVPPTPDQPTIGGAVSLAQL